MFLGYRLRMLRKSKAMSQEDLGRKLGVSKVSISGYEKGIRVPSMETLMAMLKIFDVSADYMLGRDLNIACEKEDNMLVFSTSDVDIIDSLRKKPKLYNQIAQNPDRFFDILMKNDI